MKLKGRSNYLLSITKAKAKMYELGVDEVDHLELPIPPDRLLIPMIGIIGEFCAQENRGNYSSKADVRYEYLRNLKSELINVAQYFEALNNSKTISDISDYLKLICAVAYYIADMPGSSSVIANLLPYNIERLTPNYLEGAIILVLKNNLNATPFNFSDGDFSADIKVYIEAYRNYFSRLIDKDDVINIGLTLRKKVLSDGNDREVIFTDLLLAIVKLKMENSSLNCLPKFTSLPIESWDLALKKSTFIQEFWPAQKLLGEKGVFNGASAVIQMPTSAGKTKSMEVLIRSSFLSERTGLAVLIAPFRALCREIADNFSIAFEGENVVLNELLDVPQISNEESDFLQFLLGADFKNPNERKAVIIATPEKFVYLLRKHPEITDKIGLLIFDEGHQFDSGERGVTFELLVSSLIGHINPQAQVVLISAVISNAKTIGAWLYGDAGVEIEGKGCLPTVRSIAFSHLTLGGGQLMYQRHEDHRIDGYFVPKVIEVHNLGRQKRELRDRLFPVRNKPLTIAAYLGLKLSNQAPTAIFCGTRVAVNSICECIIEAFDRGLELSPPFEKSNEEEIRKLASLASLHFGSGKSIPVSIRLGVLPHSASVPHGLRAAIEYAMEHGMAALVVCTSTLAQGVNLPIKYLLISSTTQSKRRISNRDFHNLIGRAGRSGHHTEGSVIFTNPKIYDEKFTPLKAVSREWQFTMDLLDQANNEDCLSTLKTLVSAKGTRRCSFDIIEFVSNPAQYRDNYFHNTTVEEKEKLVFFELLQQKQVMVEKIESFMLSHLKDNNEYGGRDFLNRLVRDTLAFHLSNDEEKELLITTFELIAESVLAVPESKWETYGKSLLGIAQLRSIEDWLPEKMFELELSQTIFDVFEVCFSIILKLGRYKLFESIQPKDELYLISKAWIEGKSYESILDSLKESDCFVQSKTKRASVKLNHLIDYFDNALAYESVLIIGAVADILELSYADEETAGRVRSLQTSLKIGLPNLLSKWFYHNGVIDREICKRIANELQAQGVGPDESNPRRLKHHSQLINSILSEFPSYFSNLKLFDIESTEFEPLED